MTFDAPDEDVARVVFTDGLEMRVETMTIHIDVEAASAALRTNLYLSALDPRSQSKNCIVRDQSLPFLDRLLLSEERGISLDVRTSFSWKAVFAL
jgi:hypothetical protein